MIHIQIQYDVVIGICLKEIRMPSVRRMILGHVMSGLCSKMNRTKKLQGDLLETPMKRCLSTFDITLLGKYAFSAILVVRTCTTTSRDITYSWAIK